MKFNISLFCITAMVLATVLQGCSSDDEPEPREFDFKFPNLQSTAYERGSSVSVHSEKGPQSGQKHRSSNNFSTKGLDTDDTPPHYMLVSCPGNITFKVNIDVKGGSDKEWAKEVYNGAILPYRSEDKFYIADPSGATSSFDVKFTAISPEIYHEIVSSPGRCLNGQKHRASDNFILYNSCTRYRVHISDPDVKFDIYEDISAANDKIIAKRVGDGDFINASKDYPDYYLADVSADGPFQVLFEPVTVEWMSMLPGGMSLLNVSIPGTHDTGTYDLESINFGFSKCQNMNINQQLDFGIRYFDLRVTVELITKTMYITHGGLPCLLTFDHVICWCNEFLEAHPNEVIIFELTAESDDMPELFKKYLNEASDEIRNRFYLKETVPLLNDARGKIVVLRRYPLPDSMKGEKWGLDFSGNGVWPDDGVKSGTTPGGIKYYIEDRYFSAGSTDDHDTKEKQRLVNAGIDDIGSDTQTLYLLFASVSASLWHTPYDFMWGGGTGTVSPEMGEALRDKLSEVTGDEAKKVGWIVMDYYNRDGYNDDCHVVERIINTNFPKDRRPFDISRLHSQYD